MKFLLQIYPNGLKTVCEKNKKKPRDKQNVIWLGCVKGVVNFVIKKKKAVNTEQDRE